MLNRDQLETFATVAEEQSFDRAASRLNITRGAVSQRIKALEESLATVLLVREKPIAPTPAGEILLRHVTALRMLEGGTAGIDPDAQTPCARAPCHRRQCRFVGDLDPPRALATAPGSTGCA